MVLAVSILSVPCVALIKGGKLSAHQLEDNPDVISSLS